MLQIKDGKFYLNGEEFRILSGAVHYFRMPRGKWKDIIYKARLMGLNTVETIIPWNIHEPQKGVFCFDGMYDICAFLDEIQAAGMYAIVRPSPYTCGEWDFGGFPAWLLKDENIRLRCMDERYIAAVSDWYDKLIPMLAAHSLDKGGNIIAVQIENEYGSYGNDHTYMRWLKDKLQALGFDDTLLFTADGPGHFMLQGGTMPDVFMAANFGSRGAAAKEIMEQYQPGAPFFCAEFWNGWFNHWGEPDASKGRSDEACVVELDEILKLGGSVNLYMFYGGTNYGFMAGANYIDEARGYQPDTTSYDYGAPLNECGDITPKYRLMRECLAKYTKIPDEPLPEDGAKINYGSHLATGSVQLFDALDMIGKKIHSAVPYPMERFDQDYGYILYLTKIEGPRPEAPVILQEVRDRALVFADGRQLGVIDRKQKQQLPLEIGENGVALDVLVENLARINYGPKMKDAKGVTEGIIHGQQFLFDYDIHCLPMDDLDGLQFSNVQEYTEPAFYQFLVDIAECADTFLDMRGWGKGFVTVNGFNLGRYWDIGPEYGLYLPKELLHTGENEIIVFEEHKCGGKLAFAEQLPRE